MDGRHSCHHQEGKVSLGSRYLQQGANVPPKVAKVLVCSPRKLVYHWPMDLSLSKLKQAVSIREQIEVLEARLNALFAGAAPSSAAAPMAGAGRRRRRGRRSMSAATRAKLSASAKARWARRKAGGGATASKSSRKKGGLTAEGRRRLSEAMKARWAARRRQGRR